DVTGVQTSALPISPPSHRGLLPERLRHAPPPRRRQDSSAMEMTQVHTFEHPIAKCWEMFHDPDSHVAKFTAMGHRDLEVIETDRRDGHLRIVIDRVVDVEVP